MQCIQCDSNDLGVCSYAGCDPGTGYKDCGVKYFCRTCGAEFDDDDLRRIAEKEKAK